MNRFRSLLPLLTCLFFVAFAQAQDKPAQGTTHVTLGQSEVQRVILPETVTTGPGLTIENEYRPASQVGGDFNQIIPHPAQGSLLIVAM
jgi:serine phosphatase RsbU (regulator of sigma subunit)